MKTKKKPERKKAQSAMEMLLLIGGAVLIAAIAFTVLTSSSDTAAETVQTASEQTQASQQSLQQLVTQTRTNLRNNQEGNPSLFSVPPEGNPSTSEQGINSIDIEFFLDIIQKSSNQLQNPSFTVKENAIAQGRITFNAITENTSLENIDIHVFLPDCLTVQSSDFTATPANNGTDLLWESPQYTGEVTLLFEALAGAPETCNLFAEYRVNAVLPTETISISNGGAVDLEITSAE